MSSANSQPFVSPFKEPEHVIENQECGTSLLFYDGVLFIYKTIKYAMRTHGKMLTITRMGQGVGGRG